MFCSLLSFFFFFSFLNATIEFLDERVRNRLLRSFLHGSFNLQVHTYVRLLSKIWNMLTSSAEKYFIEISIIYIITLSSLVLFFKDSKDFELGCDRKEDKYRILNV